jgi:hypothetical protein
MIDYQTISSRIAVLTQGVRTALDLNGYHSVPPRLNYYPEAMGRGDVEIGFLQTREQLRVDISAIGPYDYSRNNPKHPTFIRLRLENGTVALTNANKINLVNYPLKKSLAEILRLAFIAERLLTPIPLEEFNRLYEQDKEAIHEQSRLIQKRRSASICSLVKDQLVLRAGGLIL